MRDLKYLFAYTVPLAAYVSFQSTGIWTYSLVFYAFLIIPLLDIITGESSENLAEEDVSYKKTKWVFDLMLYLNVPLVFGLLFLAFFNVATRDYSTAEYVGLAISGGIFLATNGINVAHELGHRKALRRPVHQQVFVHALPLHAFLHRAQFRSPPQCGNTGRWRHRPLQSNGLWILDYLRFSAIHQRVEVATSTAQKEEQTFRFHP